MFKWLILSACILGRNLMNPAWTCLPAGFNSTTVQHEQSSMQLDALILGARIVPNEVGAPHLGVGLYLPRSTSNLSIAHSSIIIIIIIIIIIDLISPLLIHSMYILLWVTLSLRKYLLHYITLQNMSKGDTIVAQTQVNSFNLTNWHMQSSFPGSKCGNNLGDQSGMQSSIPQTKWTLRIGANNLT